MALHHVSFLFEFLLIVVGFFAGIINILAGGGSNLTIPALMILGLPADISNATNRVGVMMQCIVGTLAFKKAGKLPAMKEVFPIIVPCFIGGLIGGLFASYAPRELLKYILLGTMLLMATIMLFRPSTIMPPKDAVPFTLKEKPKAWYYVLVAGLYGGFVQAGVGFIMITITAGILRYDLVRSNSIKLVCSGVFTAISLVVFISRGQVMWLPGILLAIGTMVGAKVGVKLAIKLTQTQLKWILFIMTLVACIAAILS